MTIDYLFFAMVIHFYTWVLVSLLILIIGTIGLFYQRKFQYKVKYHLFFVSLIITLSEIIQIVSAEYEMIEFIETLAVLTAAVLSIRLYQQMTEGA